MRLSQHPLAKEGEPNAKTSCSEDGFGGVDLGVCVLGGDASLGAKPVATLSLGLRDILGRNSTR